jgi:chlorinating enzyme
MELKKIQPDIADQALGTNCHLLFPSLCEIASRPALLDAVEQVIGPNIILWSAGFFIKYPQTKSFVSWHQDSTYWGLEPPDIVTAWVAFTPSNLNNGCMQVVPGSHLLGQLEHEDTFADENMLSRGQEIKVKVDDEDIESIVLKPGQMSLHHVRIFHGSQVNHTDAPRIGFAMRFIPTHVYQNGGRTHALLVRGKDEFNNFDSPRLPQQELGASEWEMHQQSLERLNEVVLKDAARASKAKGHQMINKKNKEIPS